MESEAICCFFIQKNIHFDSILAHNVKKSCINEFFHLWELGRELCLCEVLSFSALPEENRRLQTKKKFSTTTITSCIEIILPLCLNEK